MHSSVGHPPLNGQDSPEVRHMPEPDEDWGAIPLDFCPRLRLVREGGSVGKAKYVSQLPPPGSPPPRPPSPFPRDRSHFNLGEGGTGSTSCLEPRIDTDFHSSPACPFSGPQALSREKTPTQGLTEAASSPSCSAAPPAPGADPWSRGHHGGVGADKAVVIQPGFDDSSTRTPFSAVPSCVPSPSGPDIQGGPPGRRPSCWGWGSWAIFTGSRLRFYD